MGSSKSVVILLISSSLSLMTYSYGQDKIFPNLLVRLIDQRIGLSETSNAFFSEDSQNGFWISSIDGLNRFNGHQVITYRPNSSQSGKPFSNIVSSRVFEDSLHRFWFSTDDGLHHVGADQKRVSSWRLQEPTTQQYLKDAHLINLDKDGTLWIKSGQWLYKADCYQDPLRLSKVGDFPKNGRRYFLVHKTTAPYFDIIASNLENDTFHLIELNKAKAVQRIRPFKVGYTGKALYNMAIEGDSMVWMLSADGLYQYNYKHKRLRNIKPYRPSFGIDKETMFIDLISYDQQYLWLLTYQKGLFVFDKKKLAFVKHYTCAYLDGEKVPFNRLDKIFVGKDGTIWLANWERGLFYFNPRLIKFNSIFLDRMDHSSSKLAVTGMVVKTKNELYFAVPNHGPFKATNQNNTWEVEQLLDAMPNCKRVVLLDDRRVVLADSKTLYLYDEATQKANKIYALPAAAGNLKDLFLLDNQHLVIRTDDSLFTFDLVSQQVVKNKFPKVSELNTCFVLDGLLFLNHSSDELLIVKPGKNDHQIIARLSGTGRINHISQSKIRNTFWIASSQGLKRLQLTDQKHLLQSFSGTHASLQQSFNAVIEDIKGNLWLASNAGILKGTFHKHDINIQRFTENDGVLNHQFSEGVAALAEESVFFGGPRGIHTIDVLNSNQDAYIPKICLEEIAVNGLLISKNGKLCDLQYYAFRPNQRNLSFKFNSSDYYGLKENLYQYRIYKNKFYGTSAKWINMGSNSVINLAGLNKGRYVLEIVISNSDGIWMNKNRPKRIHFSIQPYWYETIWFYGLISLIFLGATYLIYRNRLARIQDRANLTDTELKILRLQMNPHFIYNCLSAIQSYVIKQNVDKANGLITSFGKLMRRVLSESAKSYLSLSDETELLESYLKTESLRFENLIHYRIEIDPQLDPDEVFVPAMILQPFVENAIVHGFKNKTAASLIQVIFRPQGPMLACIVEDNGGGLGSSINSAHHQSKAIEITKRRLKLISAKRNLPASLQIINRADEDPQTTGVRALILVPRDLKPD